jgi:catalase
VIGAWGSGVAVLEAADCAGAPGILRGESGLETLTRMREQLAFHRVWDR